MRITDTDNAPDYTDTAQTLHQANNNATCYSTFFRLVFFWIKSIVWGCRDEIFSWLVPVLLRAITYSCWPKMVPDSHGPPHGGGGGGDLPVGPVTLCVREIVLSARDMRDLFYSNLDLYIMNRVSLEREGAFIRRKSFACFFLSSFLSDVILRNACTCDTLILP